MFEVLITRVHLSASELFSVRIKNDYLVKFNKLGSRDTTAEIGKESFVLV